MANRKKSKPLDFNQTDLKLNLGCGNKKLDGYINIDYSDHCSPDYLMDLENLPYPFKTDSVSKLHMESVIEHLPLDPKKFFPIIQELYRICDHQATIYIECPYPHHRWQIVDFTHQKPIHIEGIRLLSRTYCEKLVAAGATDTPLALMFDVDFEILNYECTLDPQCRQHITNVLGFFDESKIESYKQLFNNVGATQKITLEVLK